MPYRFQGIKLQRGSFYSPVYLAASFCNNIIRVQKSNATPL